MIVFSSVSKQFLPDVFALKDVSLEIDPGEFVLLTGPSGSGKTTLMKLLTKEYSPTSGDIIFHNINLNDIKESKIHEHRRKIGVVFQDYNLISELNVWENIALPLSIIGKSESEIEERVTDLLELVSLTDKAFYFPKQLSGGEAQRISIARALSTAPSIIFADEPTGNLDKNNSLQIAKLLSKINELGTTVLFATHDHDVINVLSPHRHIILTEGILISDSAEKSKKKTNSSNSKDDSSENGDENKAKTENSKTDSTDEQEKNIKSSKQADEENKNIEDGTKKTEISKEKQTDATNLESKPGFFKSLFSRKKTVTNANIKSENVTINHANSSDNSNAKSELNTHSDNDIKIKTKGSDIKSLKGKTDVTILSENKSSAKNEKNEELKNNTKKKRDKH